MKLGKKAERGVALLVVLSTLALVATVVADFQFNSRVDLQLALNARDELQAEYNALSAMRLRAMLLKNANVLGAGLRGLATSMGADPSMVPPVAQLLEMVPVDCGLMSAIVKRTGDDAGAKGGEPFFPGECSASSKSEAAKISLVALSSTNPQQATQAAGMLLGFLSDPKLARFFEQDDKSGSHAESPQELVSAIIDWADSDKNQTGNAVGDEDRAYSYLHDPYRAKNAPFDSTSELQLVHGVSDELYDILKDRVSVYNNSPQVELATADDLTVALGLCGALKPGSDCASLITQPALWTAMKAMREAAGGIAPLTLTTLTAMVNSAGLPVDASKLSQVFSDHNSTTWYTLEADGSVGNAHKRVRAVFQTGEGQLYYFRME